MGDIGEGVERSEEEESGDAVGMRGGSGRCNAGADGLTEEDDRGVGRNLGECFVRGGQKGGLRGMARAFAVAGVFEDVDGDGAVGRGGAEDGGVVGAVDGVAGVSVRERTARGGRGSPGTARLR